MLFPKKPRQARAATALQTLGIEPDWDPLDAVPRVTAGVEAKTAADGRVQLRYLPPARSRLERFCRHTLQLQRAVRINLDERGSFFWGLIDSRRNLHDVARRVAREYGLSADQAWTATIVFTRELMRRGVVQLELPRQPAAASKG
jgi:hypothetical protein